MGFLPPPRREKNTRRKFKAGLYDSTSHRQVDLYPTLHIGRRRRMFCGCRHSIERLVPMTMSNHFHKPPHTQSRRSRSSSRVGGSLPACAVCEEWRSIFLEESVSGCRGRFTGGLGGLYPPYCPKPPLKSKEKSDKKREKDKVKERK